MSVIFSQELLRNKIGSSLFLDHYHGNESPLGTRNDLGIGLDLNYLRGLTFFVDSTSIQKHYNSTFFCNNFSFWQGLRIGMNGYYENTDSIIMHETRLSIATVSRLYHRKGFFIEGGLRLQNTLNKNGVPGSRKKIVVISESKVAGFGLEFGIGYQWSLSEHISFEPYLSYLFMKSFFYYKDKQEFLWQPYELMHDFNIHLSLNYLF